MEMNCPLGRQRELARLVVSENPNVVTRNWPLERPVDTGRPAM